MKFDDWFYGLEKYSLRCERFYAALESYAMDIVDSGHITEWLRAAYEVGREHRDYELMDDGK